MARQKFCNIFWKIEENFNFIKQLLQKFYENFLESNKIQ
jgi:hypothetical protein